MSRPMRTSRKGLELIKSFEGFRARSVQLSNGKWVIGYGHTKSARANLRVSPDDAELILRFRDLKPIEKLVSERVLCPLSQSEFDALVSFAFNIGEKAFLASEVLSQLNRGERLAAAEEMSVWRKGKIDGDLIVVDVFVRRRAAEKALFLEHPSGRVSLPTALVRPQRDDAVRGILVGPSELELQERQRLKGRVRLTADRNETTPQAAARGVAERLSRIVGEMEQAQAEPDLPPVSTIASELEDDAAVVIDDPSIQEITAAISALADPAEEGELPEPPGLSGPPEGIERRRPLNQQSVDLEPVEIEPLNLSEPVLTPIDTDFIDDTEIVEVSEDDIQRALRENGEVGVPINEMPGVLYWLPFALLSGLGLIGLIAGTMRFLSPANSIGANETSQYAGPVLALGGGFLAVISIYYLFRALTRAD